ASRDPSGERDRRTDVLGAQNASLMRTYHHGLLRVCGPVWGLFLVACSLPVLEHWTTTPRRRRHGSPRDRPCDGARRPAARVPSGTDRMSAGPGGRTLDGAFDDPRTQVLLRRRPGLGVGRTLLPRPEIADLAATGLGEPDIRYAPAVGELDLLAVLARLGRHLGRDAAPAKGGGDAHAVAAGVLVRQRHQD